VLGRDDIAEPLERMLPYVLSEKANIEVLTLLLALSDQPATAIEFNEKNFIQEEVVQKEITWEEIVAEEPLRGDHWKEPIYSDSDEDDWVYDPKTVERPESPPGEAPPKPVAEVQESADPALLEAFLQRQYWIQRQRRVLVEDNKTYQDDYFAINEIDAIREVLFMLLGWESILFSISKSHIKVQSTILS
jgi:gamma-tubulin complex component 5